MEYNIGGEYQLKISSKKLKSGKSQVKFHASICEDRRMYGYLLAEQGESLSNVVEKIVSRLEKVGNRTGFHHINLFSIGGKQQSTSNLLMFDA